ncbi:uncharacterized protein LOC128995565 [Macrosteles quadrilineatus]|uniref:uncharacterized protein LOC128995565 n=1 Tax=Macrosteles quadrilineatus TaxID=74068 RepID=UPI0023E17333|nr:uncharacterized protein LOC128995565 [Macrosteles quadrilineatus]
MRNGGQFSRLRDGMAALLTLAASFMVLACLLQTAVSEHKKKIIVKVPHVIKHIHHDVYKPVHIHKVHAKKLEHHHEEHEEILPRRRPKKHRGVKHQARGSYSHLQPVLVQRDHQDHAEHLASQRGMEHREEQGYSRGQDYHSHEADWSMENESEDTRGRHQDQREQRPTWEPINVNEWFGRGKGENEDDWLISSEDLRELREEGVIGGKRNLHRSRKEKLVNFPTKPTVIGMQKEGWKPMSDFRGWKDVGELHNHRGYNRDPMNYSREESEGSEEDSLERFPEYIPKERKKMRKTKNAKWSKQIDFREPSSEEEHYTRPAYHSAHSLEAEFSENHPQPRRKPQAPQNWPEALPVPQPQQWPQPSTSPPQSHPSSVIWSGHHLQTPQHSMWHVQQHNVKTPVEAPVKSQSVLPHNPVPLQTQQKSASSHRVTPAWPATQRTPGVMQKWEQSVQMGDGDGAGSAYKVEVINYSKQ